MDGWVGGKGALLNLYVAFLFFLGGVCGWCDGIRKISNQAKEREELIN